MLSWLSCDCYVKNERSIIVTHTNTTMDFSEPHRLRRMLRPLRAKLSAIQLACKTSPSILVEGEATEVGVATVSGNKRRSRSISPDLSEFRKPTQSRYTYKRQKHGHDDGGGSIGIGCNRAFTVDQGVNKLLASLVDIWRELLEKVCCIGNDVAIVDVDDLDVPLQNIDEEEECLWISGAKTNLEKYGIDRTSLGVLAAIQAGLNPPRLEQVYGPKDEDFDIERLADMEETWYYSVPVRYRRYILLGHAASLITASLPIPIIYPRLIQATVEFRGINSSPLVWLFFKAFIEQSPVAKSKSEWIVSYLLAKRTRFELEWIQSITSSVLVKDNCFGDSLESWTWIGWVLFCEDFLNCYDGENDVVLRAFVEFMLKGVRLHVGALDGHLKRESGKSQEKKIVKTKKHKKIVEYSSSFNLLSMASESNLGEFSSEWMFDEDDDVSENDENGDANDDDDEDEEVYGLDQLMARLIDLVPKFPDLNPALNDLLDALESMTSLATLVEFDEVKVTPVLRDLLPLVLFFRPNSFLLQQIRVCQLTEPVATRVATADLVEMGEMLETEKVFEWAAYVFRVVKERMIYSEVEGEDDVYMDLNELDERIRHCELSMTEFVTSTPFSKREPLRAISFFSPQYPSSEDELMHLAFEEEQQLRKKSAKKVVRIPDSQRDELELI